MRTINRRVTRVRSSGKVRRVRMECERCNRADSLTEEAIRVLNCGKVISAQIPKLDRSFR